MPGTIRIAPNEQLRKVLRDDYAQMKEMLPVDALTFDQILEKLCAKPPEPTTTARRASATAPTTSPPDRHQNLKIAQSTETEKSQAISELSCIPRPVILNSDRAVVPLRVGGPVHAS